MIIMVSACDKEALKVETGPNKVPIQKFSIVFDLQGGFKSNDASFLTNYPQMEKAITSIASNIHCSKSLEEVLFVVNDDGIVESNDLDYDGRYFIEILVNEADFSYFDKDLSISFDRNGYRGVSDESVFTQYPGLVESFIEGLHDYKTKIPQNETFTITFATNGSILVNDMQFPLFEQNKVDRYKEFKDCVGHYWWSPGFNVVFCGVGELLAWAFDW
ncbi:MAG: hypothetical protein PHU27_11805 [Salinivirgaceae bacterium]|nr:hypothetical protein [Salinivirgaceae bacterium]MDY0280969.1 hypothetical protein [Salinivirgaceae bacterium]